MASSRLSGNGCFFLGLKIGRNVPSSVHPETKIIIYGRKSHRLSSERTEMEQVLSGTEINGTVFEIFSSEKTFDFHLIHLFFWLHMVHS